MSVKTLLTFNAGSSTVKIGLFALRAEGPVRIARGVNKCGLADCASSAGHRGSAGRAGSGRCGALSEASSEVVDARTRSWEHSCTALF